MTLASGATASAAADTQTATSPPANVQEIAGYEPTSNASNKRSAALAVVADRGFSLPRVFEYNTRRRIASVMPHRRRGGLKSPLTPQATDRWDEQGVPICQHCGGGTDFVKDFVDRGMPRIWYRCTLPQTDECRRAILSEARSEHERVHAHNRDRIGPDCLALRPQTSAPPGNNCVSPPPSPSSGCVSATAKAGSENTAATKNPAAAPPSASTSKHSHSGPSSAASAAAPPAAESAPAPHHPASPG